MIKAIWFDFDGVLTLDKNGSYSTAKYISSTAGIDMSIFSSEYSKYNADLQIGKLKHEDVWESICDAIGLRIDIGFLHEAFIHTPINFEGLSSHRS